MRLGHRWSTPHSIGVIVLAFLCAVIHTDGAYGQTVQSDDFHSTSLNPMWTFVDPVGDVDLVLSGTNALIRVPGGTTHSMWIPGHNAARLLQSTANVNFEVEAKFDSKPSRTYQLQGIVVQEDADTYLRFEIHYGGSPRIFAAFVNGVNPPVTALNAALPAVPPYLRVKRTSSTWEYKYSYDGIDWTTAVTFTRALVVTQVGPFAGNSATPDYLAPAFVANLDYFFHTASPIAPEDGGDPTAPTPPVVDVWYGDSQAFGVLGAPQQWINIVGTVWDTDTLVSLSYSLNGGPSQPLTIGPDVYRLAETGCFNAEIDYATLLSGPNTVEISAVDNLNEQRHHPVTIHCTKGVVWELPCTTSFSTASQVSDAAQVVDGRWFVTGGGARLDSTATGYDRCMTIGDRTWIPNYEVTVPFKIHKHGLGGTSQISAALGWQGHTGAEQPRLSKPYGAMAMVTNFPSDPKLVLRDNTQIKGEKSVLIETGKRYVLKVRSQTFAIGLARVSVKLWEDGVPEPAGWDISSPVTARDGSIALFAGYTEATFGDVSVEPLEPLGVRSDDFSSAELDTSIWDFIDPRGDATLTLTGTNAIVYVPGGRRHTYEGAENFAPRLMQAAEDTDFEVQAGFGSSGSYWYQVQGLLVEEDADSYIRFDAIYGAGDKRVFVGYLDNGVFVPVTSFSVPQNPAHLRLRRSGITWSFDYSYDGLAWTRATFFNNPLVPTKVGATFHNTDGGTGFAVATPAFVGNIDYFFNTSLPIVPEDGGAPAAVTPPTVDVWYGAEQRFGHLGLPQKWVNIPGTAWDTDDVVSLSYTVNGGPSNPLTIGPDQFRLIGVGDFDIEIDYADLVPGLNDVVITAVDSLGERTDRLVTVDYTDGVTWEMPYFADWSSATELSDVAHAVDGRWLLTEDGVRTDPNCIGYDRLIVMGDRRWGTDYEVIVPLTIHGGAGWSGVGVVLGWASHMGVNGSPDPEQPRRGFRYQSLAWVRSLPFGEDPKLQLEDDGTVRAVTAVPMEIDVRYILKLRSETSRPGISLVRVKYWAEGAPEPADWMLSDEFTSIDGSILLLAHYASVTFGDVTITPMPSFPLHTLTTTVADGGSIVRFPDYAAYSDSSSVKLTAVPEPGWTFQQWTGGLSGTANPVTITMVRDTTISAVFKQGQFWVKLSIAGNGSAVVDPVKTSYMAGDTIVLSAAPDPGHFFHSWYGDYESMDNPDTLVVTKNLRITALFFSEITGIDTPPLLDRLTVLQNSPNPFSRQTHLHIGLPAAADVALDVYDVAGRRVFSTRIPGAAAGWNRVVFSGNGNDGRPLPSGVYYYRVTTRGAAVTNRMVILR